MIPRASAWLSMRNTIVTTTKKIFHGSGNPTNWSLQSCVKQSVTKNYRQRKKRLWYIKLRFGLWLDCWMIQRLKILVKPKKALPIL